MTAEEVLQNIEKQKEEAGIAFLGNIYLTVEEYRMVMEALEKQIPKKPTNKSLEFDGKYGYCPCCNRILADHSNFRRCPDCGQALDWSDTE